jgi:hypothetical protein
MKCKHLFFLALTCLLSAASPASANDWFQRGFVEGIAYQRQSCMNQASRQIAYLSRQNQELRRQLMQSRGSVQAVSEVPPARPSNASLSAFRASRTQLDD